MLVEIPVNVSFLKHTLTMTAAVLVEGDYNTSKLVFNFEEDVSGKRIVFKMSNPSEEPVLVQDLDNNELVLVGWDKEGNACSLFATHGIYPIELVLYGDNSKITSAPGWLTISKRHVPINGEAVSPYLPLFDKVLAELRERATFVRFSQQPDGTDFTEDAEGALYVGYAFGDTAPEDKSGYDWFPIGTSENTEERLDAIEKQLSDITYKEITASLSVTPYIAEMGQSVKNAELTWSISKDTKHVALYLPGGKGAFVPRNGVYQYIDDVEYTSDATWTLKAIEADEKGATATATATLSFYNGVYYGAAAEPETYSSNFILGLTKTLRNNKLPSFSANAGVGQYIYYCLPKRMGTCSFKVGGFDGGFTLVKELNFTNASGYTETYYIYRSDNAALGTTSVIVT